MNHQDYTREIEEISIDFFHASNNVKKHNLDLAMQYVKQGLAAFEKLATEEIEDEDETQN